MTKKYRTLLISLGLVVVTILAGLVTILGLVSGRPALPNPNGYDDFVRAGRHVTGKIGGFIELDRSNLDALVTANAEPLRVLRVGLTRRCAASADLALTNTPGLTSELAGMKHLAQLLAAEGRLHEMEDRPAEAARSYSDVIRFGNEMSRDGLLITRLVGIACESIGCHALGKIVPRLNCNESRVVLGELEKVDANRVTWAEVLRSEKSCTRYHMRHHLNPVVWVVGWWNTRQAAQKAEARHKNITAHERLLMAELALRCYRCEKGTAPTHLDDLVTNYLSKVPQDPFGSGPMIYRSQSTTNWLVYSIGPDGVDDDGRPAEKGWPIKGDILFDSSW